MLRRLFDAKSSTADFPERVALPHLTDNEAAAALNLLRLLVECGQADVYTQGYTPTGEAPRWSVWINPTADAPGQSYTLETWAISILFPSTNDTF
jgi:hypothetical protein